MVVTSNLTLAFQLLTSLFDVMQAIQIGPTALSRYWLYWVPAQYVEAIKDTVLGKWQYF